MKSVSIKASIITIGDELIIGQTIDTNSSWIAKELNLIGIWVRRRIAVGDNKDDIRSALDEESAHSNIIIITGGLGPTADDITKPFLAEYFDCDLVRNQDVLKHVEFLFEQVYRRPGPLLERNKKQADVPANCTVLMNERGTAPGMFFKKNEVYYFSLPGVPHEMIGLMNKDVLPLLKKEFKLPAIVHQTLLTAGTGESMLAEHIQDFENNLPSHIRLAYLPQYGLVRIRLTATGWDKDQLEKEVEEKFAILKKLVAKWLVVDEDLTMAQAVSKLLKANKLTVGTAESCTGGYIAHLLSRDPGSSSNFRGSVISYDNEVKTDILGVPKQIIDEHGAVSRETIVKMVEGGLKELKSDFVVATSGIMGPDGGSEHKPVGLVWIAVGNKKEIVAKEFHFRFDRARNIEHTANAALNMLRVFVGDSI